MSQDLFEEILEYYQQEMVYLRRSGARFSDRYPRVAQRLNISSAGSSDPHVERLLESFAFLTARLQKEIDNKFIRFSNTLLGALYPQFTTPFPSATITKFRLSPNLGKATAGYTVPKGTKLFAEAVEGQTARFQTCYPVELWPFDITKAGLISIDDVNIPQTELTTQRLLRLRIERYDGPLKELSPQTLRVHIAGDAMTSNLMYDALFSYAAGEDTPVYIQEDSAKTPRLLPQGSMQPVGFAEDEMMVPFPQEAHKGYQLLQEFFAFSEKFKFFDLHNLDFSKAKKYVDILIPLSGRSKSNRFKVGRDNFVLGCTPSINLFSKISEPIDLHHRSISYRLIGDQRNEASTEIHTIKKVVGSQTGKVKSAEYAPYFSYDYSMQKADQNFFWHSFRTPTDVPGAEGSDMNLAFVDFNFSPDMPADQTAYAHVLCTNRELPTYIPAGAAFSVDGSIPPATITCLDRPTSPLKTSLDGESQWRLISQLSLNHLTLSGSTKAVAALKELLHLYADVNKGVAHTDIGLISGVDFTPIMRRMGDDAWRGFVRGLSITLTTDGQAYDGNSTFIMASVLSRFFTLYASMNSFTQLTLKSSQFTETWKKWPAQNGSQTLL